MKLGIMQPYFFPYIGYFQLIKAVDKFVFYDDVTYIKNGWINRNRILLQNQAHYITVHIKGASSHKFINEIEIIDNRYKLRKTILSAYSKAPYFKEIWWLIEEVLEFETKNISQLAQYSVIQISKYLGINADFEVSSKDYMKTRNVKFEDRLIAICSINNALEYINPIGGIELYKKSNFMREGIKLSFLKPQPVDYNQFGNAFVQNLSIIDVLMFNPISKIQRMLNSFELL